MIKEVKTQTCLAEPLDEEAVVQNEHLARLAPPVVCTREFNNIILLDNIYDTREYNLYLYIHTITLTHGPAIGGGCIGGGGCPNCPGGACC